MPHTSDDARHLLQAYAERQDRTALTEFFIRYQDELYAFALRLLRNPDDAQDAMQMTFMDVMRRADEHTRIQSVRGWLFGIVRKACRVIMRSGQRRRQREDKARKEQGRTMNNVTDSEQDSVDLKDAVLSILLRLPERYRDPVLLCCCHNLTETEAAEVLGERKGTIRVQLSRALAQIRSQLAAGGVTMSVVALPEVLGSLPVPSAPESLRPSLEHLAQSGQLRPTLRKMANGTARNRLAVTFAALVVVTATLGAGAWLVFSNDEPTNNTIPSAPTGAKALASAADQQNAEPVAPNELRLTFDERVPDLFQVSQGNVEWLASYGTFKGVLHSKPAGVIKFPYVIDARPWRIRIHYATDVTHSNPTWSCSIFRRCAPPVPPRSTWSKNFQVSLKDERPITVWLTFYYLGRYQFIFADSQLTMAGVMKEAVPSDLLTMVFKNIAIDEMEIKLLAPGEVPQELRDPDAFIKREGLELKHENPNEGQYPYLPLTK